MNWIQGIQSAIDYVEANLTGEIDYEEAANATPDITAMWQELGKDGAMARLIACMPEKPVMKGLLGICFSAELDAKRFPYGIGVEYDGRDVDDDLEVVTIPAHTYAVFKAGAKCPMHSSRPTTASLPSSSPRARSMNTPKVWNLRSILRKT